MPITSMFITHFQDGIHFWCYDVLFFNLQATNATEFFNNNLSPQHLYTDCADKKQKTKVSAGRLPWKSSS